MQVKCIESNSDAFIVDKVYRVKQIFGIGCDERDRVLIDEEGDPWKFLYRYDGGDVIGARIRAKFEHYQGGKMILTCHGSDLDCFEDVNRGRFYELAYSEKREGVYLDESIPTWRKVAVLE